MIPKIVNTNVGPNYNWREKVVSRYAPFATNDTPATKVKIIGGRLVIVDNSNQNSNGQASADARWNTPPRLGPEQGKATDAYHTSTNILEKSDFNRSPRFTQTNMGETQRLLNPHHVLPPIPSRMNQRTAADRLDDFIVSQSNLSARGMNPPLGVEHRLSDTVILPDKPVQLSLSEEAELRQRVGEDLRGLVSSRVLKDVYLELTAFDPKLTGYVHFSDLAFTLRRNQVNLSLCNQRLLAEMFLSQSEPNKIHYEQFLYFLSSSMKRNSELMRSDFMNDRELNLFPTGFQNPTGIDRELASDRSFHENVSNNSNHNFMDTDTTTLARKLNDNKRTIYNTPQLLRVVEEQLKETDARHLDIDRIWDMFRHADRSCSQVLSREQIKTLTYQCKIHLDEDILDQVIDRCHKGNDRYWWKQFLNFIGRFLMHKTGLNIPERRPVFNRVEDRVNRGFMPTDEKRLASIEKKEKELTRLEKIIQITRQRLNEMKWSSVQKEPWLKRFMSLAHAMYEFDENKTGYLTAMLARWLTREYSQGLDLGLRDEAIQTAIRRGTDDGAQDVAIEPLLRKLIASQS